MKKIIIALACIIIAVVVGITVYNDWYLRFFRKPQLIEQVDESKAIIDSLQHANNELSKKYYILSAQYDSLENVKSQIQVEKQIIYKNIQNGNKQIDTISSSQLVINIKSYLREYERASKEK